MSERTRRALGAELLAGAFAPAISALGLVHVVIRQHHEQISRSSTQSMREDVGKALRMLAIVQHGASVVGHAVP
jgi:hypothetical protein